MTTIPTISQLYTQILTDLQSEYGVTISLFGRVFLRAMAAVLSVIFKLIYLAIGLVQKNVWYDTADPEADGGTLERFGREILGRNPLPATQGQYTCTVTGTTGGTIPANTTFKSDDSSLSPGYLFILDTDFTLSGSSGSITLRALTGGTDALLAVGNTLTATAPIINVNAAATVTAVAVTPDDAEEIEDYRDKIRQKVQLEPGSWSAVDYRLVGLDVTGVGEVYAYASSGASAEVNVFIQGTTPVAYPGPSASNTVLTNYETALNAVLPLTVWDAHIASCPINDVVVTITMGSFTAYTTAEKALILAALQELVNGVKPFIAAADSVADRNDVIATFNLSAAITAAVPGKGFSAVTFTVAGGAETYWQADLGNIAFLNPVIVYA